MEMMEDHLPSWGEAYLLIGRGSEKASMREIQNTPP